MAGGFRAYSVRDLTEQLRGLRDDLVAPVLYVDEETRSSMNGCIATLMDDSDRSERSAAIIEHVQRAFTSIDEAKALRWSAAGHLDHYVSDHLQRMPASLQEAAGASGSGGRPAVIHPAAEVHELLRRDRMRKWDAAGSIVLGIGSLAAVAGSVALAAGIGAPLAAVPLIILVKKVATKLLAAGFGLVRAQFDRDLSHEQRRAMRLKSFAALPSLVWTAAGECIPDDWTVGEVKVKELFDSLDNLANAGVEIQKIMNLYKKYKGGPR